MKKRTWFWGIFFLCLLVSYGNIRTSAKETTGKEKEIRVNKKYMKKYLSNSSFIGNSIGKGQQMYFDSQGREQVGTPKMLVMGCYSFANDACLHPEYSLVYNGKHYQAKDLLKKIKAKRVFISMGTNDLWKPAEKTYQDYVAYIQGIRKKNPKLIIFIESTPPMCSAKNRRYLNNHAIRTLNRLMKKYCKKQKDMYYMDITKGMKDADGGLKRKYSSDGYVHLSMSGYEVWTNNLVDYVKQLRTKELKAAAAVKHAKKTKQKSDYRKAKKRVDKLENSTCKDKLKRKLKKITKYDTKGRG